jgi:hypothetical protein
MGFIEGRRLEPAATKHYIYFKKVAAPFRVRLQRAQAEACGYQIATNFIYDRCV